MHWTSNPVCELPLTIITTSIARKTMTAVRRVVCRSGVLWTSILQNAVPPGTACRHSLTCHTLSLSDSWMRGLAVPSKLQMHCLRRGWKTTAMHMSAQLPRGWYTMWTWVVFMSTEFSAYSIIGITAQILSALLNQISLSNCSWVRIPKGILCAHTSFIQD